MKRFFLVTFSGLMVAGLFAQGVNQKLQKAFRQFESDAQLKHAISSLYVIDAKTGKVVFDKNSQIGLAPASTQKIITSVTAFELLGKDYRYKTKFGLSENNENPNLYIIPSGDPTFGSSRWESTKEKNILDRIIRALNVANASKLESILISAEGWNSEQIPDGWIWQDIGNYYGAGAGPLNWQENQFDLLLNSGNKIGDMVEIVGTEPDLYSYKIYSLASSASKGSGDNAYIYLPAGHTNGIIRGTIPVNENHFVISGAMPDPGSQFIETLKDSLKNKFNLKIGRAHV